MAVRIPMSPDADGIIRLKCEDQELEIEIKAPQSDVNPLPPQQGGGFGSGNPKPGRPDWINPNDRPVVFMRTDFDAHALVKKILAENMRKAAADKGIVFLAQESLDFHQLFELGKSLEGSKFGEHFSVSFDSLGKRGGLG